MEEEYGIDVLKEVFKTAIEAGIKIEESLAPDSPKGEKFSLLQEGIPLFVFLLPKVISHIGNADLIKEQFLDLSQAEVDELKAFLVEEIELENENVEALIEAVIDWLDATNDFRLAVKDLVKGSE
jgi:hypothetical protein